MLDRRTMPLSALRAFEAAGRQLHMGRAGEELGVTAEAARRLVKRAINTVKQEAESRIPAA